MKTQVSLRKKFVSLVFSAVMLFTVLAMGAFAADGDVTISAQNFPDDAFRTYVQQFDTNGDGVLSQTERDAVQVIVVDFQNIQSLKGIESFTNLTALNCNGNDLKELDVSRNTKLQSLQCEANHLTSLDLTQNTQLTELTTITTSASSHNVYYVDGRTVDLTSLPGNFELSRTSGWTGGTVSGNILTINEGSTDAWYYYDCGNDRVAVFTIRYRDTTVTTGHTVTVVGGAGTSSYTEIKNVPAGQTVAIKADPNVGPFSHWQGNTDDASFNATASETTFVMPDHDVMIYAHYDTGSTGDAGTTQPSAPSTSYDFSQIWNSMDDSAKIGFGIAAAAVGAVVVIVLLASAG